MKYHSLQFALRETQRIFASRRTWGVLAVISLIIGISGPFQTFEIFAPVPRTIYWTFVVVLTFATGVFFSSWVSGAIKTDGKPLALRLLLFGVAAGIPVALVVWIINITTFGLQVIQNINVPALSLYSILIAMGITMLFILFEEKKTVGKPAIILRLPVHMRGELISLSMQDHYVEVSTDKGEKLLLMRFGDAMGETAGVEGIRIHRSHWVALSGIEAVKKNNGKTIIRTTRGRELPVSRTYMPAVSRAGLLA